jgi:hypothetical protein
MKGSTAPGKLDGIVELDVVDQESSRFGEPHACVRSQGYQPAKVIILIPAQGLELADRIDGKRRTVLHPGLAVVVDTREGVLDGDSDLSCCEVEDRPHGTEDSGHAAACQTLGD